MILCPLKGLKVACLHEFAQRHGVEEKEACPLWVPLSDDKGMCGLTKVPAACVILGHIAINLDRIQVALTDIASWPRTTGQ